MLQFYMGCSAAVELSPWVSLHCYPLARQHSRPKPLYIYLGNQDIQVLATGLPPRLDKAQGRHCQGPAGVAQAHTAAQRTRDGLYLYLTVYLLPRVSICRL